MATIAHLKPLAGGSSSARARQWKTPASANARSWRSPRWNSRWLTVQCLKQLRTPLQCIMITRSNRPPSISGYCMFQTSRAMRTFADRVWQDRITCARQGFSLPIFAPHITVRQCPCSSLILAMSSERGRRCLHDSPQHHNSATAY